MDTASKGRSPAVPAWVGWVAPVAVIAVLVAAFLILNPITSSRELPPVEAVAFERTVLNEGEIVLELRNDGPDPVTIAQVLVNDAYNPYSLSDTGASLSRLEATTMRIPYEWEEGLPLNITLVTSTGVTIGHDIEVAALTPRPDASTFGLYALLGLYIGVLPVAIGLLWFPSLKRASKRLMGFLLAFTIGLLGFLLVDTVGEGLELAGAAPAALDGLSILAIGALAAAVALLSLQRHLGRRPNRGAPGGTGHRLVLGYSIAAGIGLHNLGEGLAVGAALAAGELSLGTALVIGFALHNTTEGLAIVAPLGSEERRPSLWHFVALGAVAGAPTILGAWAGGFAYSPAWSALAFGVAAGAIAQVMWQIGRSVARDNQVMSGLGGLGFLAGLLFMYLTGLFV